MLIQIDTYIDANRYILRNTLTHTQSPGSFVYFTRGPALSLLVIGLLTLLDVVIFYFG